MALIELMAEAADLFEDDLLYDEHLAGHPGFSDSESEEHETAPGHASILASKAGMDISGLL